mmetsp:Transcript_105952/g.192780  ORF Transcript_105952/g.192780 Transcript_105952/m.192780 type:complete len:305 (+) Transcript_105952:55-969(+)
MVSIPRDVLKWLGGLNLSAPLRDVRRSVSSGILVAELCSRYFPREAATMGCFSDVSAMHLKLENWIRLIKFLEARKIPVSRSSVEAVVKGEHEAVVDVLLTLQAALAERPMPELRPDGQVIRTELENSAAMGRMLNCHGQLACRSDADVRGDDGFGPVWPGEYDRSRPQSFNATGGDFRRSKLQSLNATGLVSSSSQSSPPRFDSNVRCYASLGGCERMRLTCPEQKFGTRKHSPSVLSISPNTRTAKDRMVVSSASWSSPLAMSSKKAWRSRSHSTAPPPSFLPSADAARYPWAGGSPWHMTR